VETTKCEWEAISGNFLQNCEFYLELIWKSEGGKKKEKNEREERKIREWLKIEMSIG